MPYSITEEEGNYFYKKDKIFSNDLSISFDTNSISLQGIHNVSNIIIASEIASMIGVSNDNIHKAIREFESLEHRFEHFNSYKGIDFINDSKSTNIDSAIKALESISKKVILILGGIPKEDDFSEISLFKKNILKIIVYGKASDKIYNSLSNEIKLQRDSLKELKEILDKNEKTNFELEVVSLRNSKIVQPVVVQLNINYPNS